MKRKRAKAQYDSPWKMVIRLFFRQMMELLFPSQCAQIDWTKPYEFLDKELQKAERRSRGKRLFVDNLVRVRLLNGTQAWVLIHLEVQAQHDPQFPERQYEYNTRLHEQRGIPVISLAILADDDPKWRPASYQRGLLGCNTEFTFPICKLLDLESKLAGHRANLFAVVVRAHLAAMRTRKSPAARERAAIAIVREFPSLTLDLDEIKGLLTFVDWVCALSEPGVMRVREALRKEMKMKPYVSGFDRLAKKEGKAEGRAEARAEAIDALKGSILLILHTRFPDEKKRLNPRVEALRTMSRVNKALPVVATGTLAEIERELSRK